MLDYKAIEIFTSEAARHRGEPLAEAVVEYVRNMKIAARCIVTRGIAGCDESGEASTVRLEVLSYNLPVRISIVMPAGEAEHVLKGLDGMVGEGIVALHDLKVLSHRTRNAFFPRRLLVRDVMTPSPQSVAIDTPLDDATRLLLSSIFSGLPVVDGRGRPVGLITQGDLIARAELPLRPGLLAESDPERREKILQQLASRKASEVMTTPVITIAEDRPLSEAVEKMLTKGVKRLPVTNADGCLTGMLSRLDIFRTVMHEAPDWKAFAARKIEVQNLKQVGDILRRDTRTVGPNTPVSEVIRVIDRDDIQRVAVVDADGKLLGLISDRDLLRYFKPREPGIWGLLGRMKAAVEKDGCAGDLSQCLENTRVADVMTSDLITVGEETLIEEAVALMTEKALKRLPVVDADGRFKGMISRDSLLRAGFRAVESR
jgi:CBS-domain-containing membrane protein